MRRRVSPCALALILTGVVLILGLLGGGAGVASFLLLRAGYGFLVWGLLPVLTLLLAALALGIVLWWVTGGHSPGSGQPGVPEERPRGGSSPRGPNRGR